MRVGHDAEPCQLAVEQRERQFRDRVVIIWRDLDELDGAVSFFGHAKSGAAKRIDRLTDAARGHVKLIRKRLDTVRSTAPQGGLDGRDEGVVGGEELQE